MPSSSSVNSQPQPTVKHPGEVAVMVDLIDAKLSALELNFGQLIKGIEAILNPPPPKPPSATKSAGIDVVTPLAITLAESIDRIDTMIEAVGDLIERNQL